MASSTSFRIRVLVLALVAIVWLATREPEVAGDEARATPPAAGTSSQVAVSDTTADRDHR